MSETYYRRRTAGYQRGARERGQASTEYLGVVVVVALVLAVVVAAAPGLGQRIACGIEGAITSAGGCSEDVEVVYAGEEDPDDPGAPAATGQAEDGVGSSAEYVHDGGGGSADSGDGAHYENSQLAGEEADPEQVQQALDEIRDLLDGWWLLGVRQHHLDQAREIIEGLDPAGIDALIAEMSDEELTDWVAEMEQGWLGGGWNAGERREFWELIASQVSRETFERLEQFTDDLVSRPGFEDVGGDGARDDPESIGNNADYGEIPHVLFDDDGPSPEDVSQGAIGNCWWIASFMAIAHNDPQLIEDAITENANGTYTVTLYDGGDPVDIVVTPDMVLRDDNGTPAFVDNDGNRGGDTELWPHVLEKALAVHHGDGAGWGSGDYAETEGGWTQWGLDALTGVESQRHSTDDLSLNELQTVLNEGGAIGVETFNNETDHPLYDQDLPRDERLYGLHAYYVSDVDPEAGTVTVVNPWGPDRYPPLEMSHEDFVDGFQGVTTNEVRP